MSAEPEAEDLTDRQKAIFGLATVGVITGVSCWLALLHTGPSALEQYQAALQGFDPTEPPEPDDDDEEDEDALTAETVWSGVRKLFGPTARIEIPGAPARAELPATPDETSALESALGWDDDA